MIFNVFLICAILEPYFFDDGDRGNMGNHIDEFLSGARTAFVDAANKSNLAYKPEFISNDHKNGVKVLTSIERELSSCDSFTFSVAFITLGGIEPLLPSLKDLEERGVPGRILTTDYNTFTDPKALDKLAEFSNIELRMYHVQASENIGFHTKGYIFKKDETYTFIIGSANMTERALAVNKEWNTKLVSTEEGEMYKNISSEFVKLWNDREHTDLYEECIESYRTRFEVIKKQKKIALQYAKDLLEKELEEAEDGLKEERSAGKAPVSLEQYNLRPNSMQVDFINNLRGLVENGENKALLVSATATGKTYASAFGVRDAMAGNRRVLFLVHREQIARQVEGAVSFHNQTGCSQVPSDMQYTMDVLAGFAANPNVYGTIVIALGCENCQCDLVVDAIRERTCFVSRE